MFTFVIVIFGVDTNFSSNTVRPAFAPIVKYLFIKRTTHCLLPQFFFVLDEMYHAEQ